VETLKGVVYAALYTRGYGLTRQAKGAMMLRKLDSANSRGSEGVIDRLTFLFQMIDGPQLKERGRSVFKTIVMSLTKNVGIKNMGVKDHTNPGQPEKNYFQLWNAIKTI
jgi:hypothetical protein